MAIEYRHYGNMFDEDLQAYVNTVNCVGVMGAGLALEFKKRFPENFLAYRKACKQGIVQPGRMFICEVDGYAIINFPTKRHWRDLYSNPQYIKDGLVDLRRALHDYQITSVAVPALGCGLGGLDWPTVRREIEEALADLDARVVVFGPRE